MKKIFLLLTAATMLAFVNVSCDRTDDTGTDNQDSRPDGEWIDLGLPSGLLWSSCNLGASDQQSSGNFYAWGEVQTKEVYDWTHYRHCTADGSGNLVSFTKYNTSATYGTTDNKTVLESGDDAATSVLGAGARIPTNSEWQELLDTANVSLQWATVNSVEGLKITSRSNGNSIFLPAAGFREGSELKSAGVRAYYWSASLCTEHDGTAYYTNITNRFQTIDYRDRFFGISVRAVWKGKIN